MTKPQIQGTVRLGPVVKIFQTKTHEATTSCPVFLFAESPCPYSEMEKITNLYSAQYGLGVSGGIEISWKRFLAEVSLYLAHSRGETAVDVNYTFSPEVRLGFKLNEIISMYGVLAPTAEITASSSFFHASVTLGLGAGILIGKERVAGFIEARGHIPLWSLLPESYVISQIWSGLKAKF